MIDNRTPALDLPLPHPDNDLEQDVPRLRAALCALDTIVAAKANGADIQAALAALIGLAPPALDTLAELAAALGNDPNFATTILEELGRVIDDGNVGASNAWSSERVASELGRSNSVALTYAAGVLTSIIETLPGGTRTTTYIYTGGVLTGMAVEFGGVMRTTTYTYTDGVLTATTTTEA